MLHTLLNSDVLRMALALVPFPGSISTSSNVCINVLHVFDSLPPAELSHLLNIFLEVLLQLFGDSLPGNIYFMFFQLQ